MTYTFHVNIYKSLCKTIEHKCICKKLLFNETNAKPEEKGEGKGRAMKILNGKYENIHGKQARYQKQRSQKKVNT